MNISGINNMPDYGQVASGKRINSAADDAAGLAISNKLGVRADGTNVAVNNAKEGVNVTKIADGAYESILDRLQRIRELSVQSMNGFYGASDLEAIQSEIDQHLMGIGEAARNTVYNEQKLLDGSMATMEIASNPTGKGSSIKLYSATLENLGLDGYSVMNGDANLDAIDNAIQMVSSQRSSLGASANGLEAGIRTNQNVYENLTASKSKIEDLDMAKAAEELNKKKTMQSVEIAMQKKQNEQDKIILRMF